MAMEQGLESPHQSRLGQGIIDQLSQAIFLYFNKKA